MEKFKVLPKQLIYPFSLGDVVRWFVVILENTDGSIFRMK
jgi:hypothetical protein